MSSGIEWTDETWRAIPGWPRFSITRDGAIRGPSGRRRKPSTARSGHLYILHRFGGRSASQSKLWVHRAVLLAWVGPCPPGREARHLNGLPSDNRLANLEAVLGAENMRRAKANGAFAGVGRRDGIRDTKGRFDKKLAGRELDGRTWDEMPGRR